MLLTTINRVALPVAVVVTVALAIVLPLVRSRRLTGAWPVARYRDQSSRERAVAVALLACGVGAGAWATLYGLVGPGRLGAWTSPPWLVVSGWGAGVLGLVTVVTAQRQMGASWRMGVDGRSTPLITTGLFRCCRHPIYAGILIAFAGLAAVGPSPAVLTIVGATAGLLLVQARLEEGRLRQAHGSRYDEWAARVGRFLPWLGRDRRAMKTGDLTP